MLIQLQEMVQKKLQARNIHEHYTTLSAFVWGNGLNLEPDIEWTISTLQIHTDLDTAAATYISVKNQHQGAGG